MKQTIVYEWFYTKFAFRQKRKNLNVCPELIQSHFPLWR